MKHRANNSAEEKCGYSKRKVYIELEFQKEERENGAYAIFEDLTSKTGRRPQLTN